LAHSCLPVTSTLSTTPPYIPCSSTSSAAPPIPFIAGSSLLTTAPPIFSYASSSTAVTYSLSSLNIKSYKAFSSEEVILPIDVVESVV